MAKNIRLTDTVSIATSGTTSTSLQMQGNRVPLAIIIPATFEGTTLTFQASVDDATYVQVYNEGTAYSVTVGTSRFVALARQPFEGVRYMKIISNNSVAATRTLTVLNGEY